MMRVACHVLSTLAILFAPPAIADETKPSREMMRRMMAEMSPGQEHAALKELVGAWEISFSMRDKEIPFDGGATAAMILGDRFLVVDGKGKVGGRESEFRYTIGFDRRHGQYTIVVMDTQGTYYVSARGKPEGEKIRMSGTDDDPHMKKMGFEKKFAFDLKIENKDQFSITTLYVDNRSEQEKLVEGMRHVFKRTE